MEKKSAETKLSKDYESNSSSDEEDGKENSKQNEESEEKKEGSFFSIPKKFGLVMLVS